MPRLKTFIANQDCHGGAWSCATLGVLSMRLRDRLSKLEVADAFRGPAAWLVLEPSETTEQGIARYEAKHGPRLPGQPAIIWHPVSTGVPRGGSELCA